MYEHGPDKEKDKLNESGFREVDEDFLLKLTDVNQLIKGSVAVKKRKHHATSSFDRITNVGKSAPSLSLSDDPLLAIRREQRKRTSDTRSTDGSERHLKQRHGSSGSKRERSPSRRHREKETDRHKHRRRHEEKPHKKEMNRDTL